MRADLKKQRINILEQVLPHVPAHGWSWEAVSAANLTRQDISVIFPDGLVGLVSYFSTFIDDKLSAELEQIDAEPLRIRERIELAVYKRFEILAPYKEAARQTAYFRALPTRSFQAPKITWKTADLIWKWTGDQSTDYNYYTKRFLLSGVISSTLLFWLGQDDPDLSEIRAFIQRRIENVMGINKLLRKAS